MYIINREGLNVKTFNQEEIIGCLLSFRVKLNCIIVSRYLTALVIEVYWYKNISYLKFSTGYRFLPISLYNLLSLELQSSLLFVVYFMCCMLENSLSFLGILFDGS